MASSTISLSGNINELAKITLDTVTNTSGTYNHTTTVNGITPDHKVLSIECGDESVFHAPITISTAANAITLSCDNVVGTSTVIVYVQMTGDNVPITSLEYSALSTRVGNLSDLETNDKSSVVNSINSLKENMITITGKKFGLVNVGGTFSVSEYLDSDFLIFNSNRSGRGGSAIIPTDRIVKEDTANNGGITYFGSTNNPTNAVQLKIDKNGNGTYNSGSEGIYLRVLAIYLNDDGAFYSLMQSIN